LDTDLRSNELKLLSIFEEFGYIAEATLDDEKKKEIYSKWKSLVNMGPKELEKYIHSDDGKKSGLSRSEASSQGIKSGRDSARAIVRMKQKSWKDWDVTDWKWANRQISFISRMKGASGPLFDEKGRKTRKLMSLLIWGHDPRK